LADDSGELPWQARERHELLEPLAGALGVEAEEAGWVALLEAAEEGGIGGVGKPALADEGGADEPGGEVEPHEDLPEEIAVVENLGSGRRRR
jgi:hypothetical protein